MPPPSPLPPSSTTTRFKRYYTPRETREKEENAENEEEEENENEEEEENAENEENATLV